MRTAAIVPVKRFAHAKRRLGSSVPDPLRARLARAMVADVLAALARTPSLERTIVVTGEHTVASAARDQGLLVLADAAERGQSAAVARGIAAALAEGAERVLCVPGDCPALDPGELELLLGHDSAAPAREVVVVPDRHGTGTNGLLLHPPDAIAPAFGPGSCARHRALAAAAGVPCRLAHPPSLLLDIDTGADLAVLRDRLARARGRARRTHAALASSMPAGPVSATAVG